MFPDDVMTRIDRARYHLFRNYPFFGELAAYLRPIPDESILCPSIEYDENEKPREVMMPTAAMTSDGRFLMHPDFAKKASAKDFIFILCHELMHVVNSTHKRKPDGANEMIWNIASDIAINYLIVESGIELPNEQTVIPAYKGFEKFFGQTHEEIYYQLMKEGKEKAQGLKEKGWHCDGGCNCDEAFKNMSESEKAAWGERITAAANEAVRKAGSLPGELSRFITEITAPKRNWRRILRLQVQRVLKKEFTWRRPSRRTIGVGIYTPGVIKKATGLVTYLDTSGSMSNKDMNEAISEMHALLGLFGGKGTLILGDAQVYFVGEITKDSLKAIPVQRGGTNFIPVFDRIKEDKLEPSIFVGFSDLEGPFPSEPPPFPVVWCRPESHSVVTPPFGTLIDVKF